jgi:hypothetical protein
MNPPPMPNMPDTKPTAAPIAKIRKTLTRNVGNGEEELHARSLLIEAADAAGAARDEVWESQA